MEINHIYNEEQEHYAETALIYNFNTAESVYLYKDIVLPDSYYQHCNLKNGKVLVSRAYNYRIKHKLPKIVFFELLNSDTYKMEWRVTADIEWSIVGEIEEGRVLLSAHEGMAVFDIKEQTIVSYNPVFFDEIDSKYSKAGMTYGDKLYLYVLEEKDNPDRKLSIFWYDKKKGEFVRTIKLIARSGSKVMVSDESAILYGNPFELVNLRTGGIRVNKGRPNKARYDLIERDFQVLDDGNLLITSGYGGNKIEWGGTVGIYHDSIELYIVSEDRFVLFQTPQKNGKRKSAKLSNGDILLYDNNSADLFRRKTPPQP